MLMSCDEPEESIPDRRVSKHKGREIGASLGCKRNITKGKEGEPEEELA